MAERKNAADAGQAEAQKIQDQAEDKGHFGEKPESKFSNEDFSLKTGPDSPSAAEQTAESLAAIADQSRASAQEG